MINTIKYLIRGEMPTSWLKKRGLVVGKNFSRQRGCIIDPHHCWLIEIGDNVTFAPNVHILAHDASTKKVLGYTKIGKVIIKNNVFVGAGTIILPNVIIGNNCIIGAGSVVTHSIEDNTVVVGNPAKFFCDLENFKNKQMKLLKTSIIFDENYTYKNITKEKKKEMSKNIKKIGFIK